MAVVVAVEALCAHHVEEGARGRDAPVPRHEELHRPASGGKQLLQCRHQGGIGAERNTTEYSNSEPRATYHAFEDKNAYLT